MMKAKMYTLCLALLGLAYTARAQTAEAESSSLVATAAQRDYKQIEPSLSKRPMTVYAEGFGHAFNYISLNFETRFKPQRNGWGWRAGLSYSLDSDFPLWSFPVGINYLMGRKRHFFELGAGLTPWLLLGIERIGIAYWGIGADYRTRAETQFRLFGNATIGYRYQPPKSGFTFGLGLSPIISYSDNTLGIHPYFPYLRVGYAF